MGLSRIKTRVFAFLGAKIGQSIFLQILSFVLVAFGQNAWVSSFAFFASAVGFALFWKALFLFGNGRRSFLLSLFWFASVQAVQLSWMTATEYQGFYILIVYFFLLVGLGAQFAFLSTWIVRRAIADTCLERNRGLPMLAMLAMASFWVFMEWSRLWLFSGFTWNPVGLLLCYHHLPMQMASVAGIYGLSFWVVFVNLLALSALFIKKEKYALRLFLGALIVPYLFGFFHETFWQSRFSFKAKTLSVLLVHTSLAPEEKDLFFEHRDAFISPYLQWERILTFLAKKREKKVDLIVLPESAFPFGAFCTFCPLEKVHAVWKKVFGEEALQQLPALQEPFASFDEKKEQWNVANSYWVQALSQYFHAEIIVGLDDRDCSGRSYNAAFYFQPSGFLPKRYEKRVLVPIAEYFPFAWCAPLALQLFGISDQFTPGVQAKVFSEENKYGIFICYEETFAHLVRESRALGANCFVNISNDVWFPFSKLPLQHFEHGRLRAVENGVPLIRACNVGVTGGVDCFGKSLGFFQERGKSLEWSSGVHHLLIPMHSYPTIYTLCGDTLILALCFCFFSLFFALPSKK